MEWDELQRSLESKLEAHMLRTRPLDIFYALCCAGLFGLSIAVGIGVDCSETFLGECVDDYFIEPIPFTVGFLVAAFVAFWGSYRSIREYRRRKRWFG